MKKTVEVDDILNGQSPEEVREKLPPESHFREMLGWGFKYGGNFGAQILEATKKNLSVARNLFAKDKEWVGRLNLLRREYVTSALSELWVAAHFIGRGCQMKRPENQLKQQKKRSFDFIVSLPSGGQFCLEIKRMNPPPGKEYISKFDRPPLDPMKPLPSGMSGLVPYGLANSDFPRRALNRVNRARGQFSGTENPKVLALDISGSRTYQSCLMDNEPSNAILKELEEARFPEVDFFLLYIISWDSSSLFYYKWLPSRRTDKQIDQLVYELYNLTEEEIKIVEGE